MLGCFDVAPPRGQSISTATSGEYGGNMDYYRGFREGVTVYFPSSSRARSCTSATATPVYRTLLWELLRVRKPPESILSEMKRVQKGVQSSPARRLSRQQKARHLRAFCE
jgi:hypothetical protein